MRIPARLLLFCLIAHASGAVHAATVRDEEIAECRDGEIVTWHDGVDRRAVSPALRFYYRHDGAPPWFSRALVESLVERAAGAWSQCGIPGRLVSQDDAALNRQDTVLVQWNEAASRGNFGLADYLRHTLSLSAGAFALLHTRNPGWDASKTLQMVISHEMGHLYGLMAHSRRCVDVLSYYDDGNGNRCFTRDPAGLRAVVEYRSELPTACDIQRCRAVNGLPPLPGGRLN